MRQVAVLVEGQTEERVIAEVLAPAAFARDVVLTPIIVRTSAGHRRADRGATTRSNCVPC